MLSYRIVLADVIKYRKDKTNLLTAKFVFIIISNIAKLKASMNLPQVSSRLIFFSDLINGYRPAIDTTTDCFLYINITPARLEVITFTLRHVASVSIIEPTLINVVEW